MGQDVAALRDQLKEQSQQLDEARTQEWRCGDASAS